MLYFEKLRPVHITNTPNVKAVLSNTSVSICQNARPHTPDDSNHLFSDVKTARFAHRAYVWVSYNSHNKGNDKVHPVTGHEDPEGEQLYLYSSFNLGAR